MTFATETRDEGTTAESPSLSFWQRLCRRSLRWAVAPLVLGAAFAAVSLADEMRSVRVRVAAVGRAVLSAAVAALVVASVLVLPGPVSAASSAGSADLGGVETVRYGGAGRYETSLLIAEAVAAEAGGSLSSVVLVSGERWTDAVVAAPIAGSLGAAVLMTPPGELRADALEFLERTGVSEAVVIGPETGGGAHGSGRGVEAAVLAALGEVGITAERVVGDDRFGTSVAAAREVTAGVMSGMGRTAIVASGEVFADALVAGPFAARGVHPVLLSAPDELPAGVASYLDTSGIDHVVVMGGTAALSADVETVIKGLGVSVTRLAGASRYDTAVKAAELVAGRYSSAAGKDCFATATVGLARARVPFDSFSAAPLLGRLCAPLVLADPRQIPADTAAFLDAARAANATVDLRVFGGDAAVSQTAIDTYLAGTGASEPDVDEAAPAGLPAGTCGGSIDDKPSQLLDSDEAEDPAWSPDCSKIVYSFGGSLWVMDNDGTSRKRLTAYDGSHSDSPVWSPDGSQIAYTRGRSDDNGHWFSHIYLVNADGTGRAKFTKGDVWDSQPSWSPDGFRIAFERRSGAGRGDDGHFVNPTQRIMVVNVDRTGLATLTSGDSWQGSPAWSPDGKRIAYVADGVIWLIDSDGTNAERVIGGAFWGGGLSWSPDGRRIAFARGDWTEASIVIAGLDRPGEEAVTELGGWNVMPRWSPDGDRIAFSHYPNGNNRRVRSAFAAGASGTPTGFGDGCRPRGVDHTTAGFPLPRWALPSTGKLRIAALFMDFPDAQASHTTHEEAELGLPYLEEYLESASYGLLDVEVKPHHVWLRAEQPRTEYGSELRTPNFERIYLNQEATEHAIELADDAIDFSTVDLVLVAFPGSHFFANSGQLGHAVKVDGVEVATVRVNSLLLSESPGSAGIQPWGFAGAHETIHALGLPDLRPNRVAGAYDRSKPPSGKRWANAMFGLMELLSWFPADPNDSRLQYDRTNPDGSTQKAYAGQVHAPEMLAWGRWQLGWLDESQVRCIEHGDSDTTAGLTPVARPGDGVAMAAIQLSSHEVIVVESRRRLGYDRSGQRPLAYIAEGSAQQLAAEGVLIYTVDTLRGSGSVPTRVAGGNGNFEHDDFPLLQKGESVTVAGYTITVTADNGDTHTVSISKSN